jgi:hypothetical protein
MGYSPGHRPQQAAIIDAMATFSGPVTVGTIIEPACLTQCDLASHGYVEEEFFADGDAFGYDLAGEAASDGAWSAVAAGSAPFRTRLVVRRPADQARFSGVVLVEWLNVSSSFDADPDWAFMHEEILRAGHAYVAVSAQAVGVMGGRGPINPTGPAAPGLRASDPARYGSLTHPGDRYSFDLFRQIGAGLRSAGGASGASGTNGSGGVARAGGAGVAPLGGLQPAYVIAIGESQSAMYLTSYINAVQPISPDFDGFLVHSRGAGCGPLSGDVIDPMSVPTGLRIRADTAAVVLVIETEGDLLPPLSYWRARQPDADRFRLWEMAGTAHADSYLIGPAAPLLGIDWRVNEGPQRYLVQAALRALVTWVTKGTPPPAAARIELASTEPPVIARDVAGNALGGVRTPVVDVPVATLSGEPPPGPHAGTAVGWLFGSTTPLADSELRRRYGDQKGYLSAYTQALDAAVSAGFLLPEHREQLLGDAASLPFPPVAAAG